jgi:hypothetical protein
MMKNLLIFFYMISSHNKFRPFNNLDFFAGRAILAIINHAISLLY